MTVLLRTTPVAWSPITPGLLLTILALVYCSHALGQTLTGLVISPAQPSVTIGAETQLTAEAEYSNGAKVNVSHSASWNSSEPRTVAISASGVAKGLATGNAALTVSYQGKVATLAVTSGIGDITWSGPITITKGGTYSGQWKSTTPGVSAVTVATAAPVVIENSYVTGPSDLINDPFYGNNLTVKNVIGIGTNPNLLGQTNGLFVDAQNPVRLDVENCYFERVLFGVWVRGYVGNRNGANTITILNNRGRNTLGLESDGKGSYLPGETHWRWAHTVQLSNMPSVPGVRIAWNEFINYPYQSLVNEVINLYEAGGTASSPALFHDNYIQGAYAYNPAIDYYNGGGFTTDGNSSESAQIASSFINIYDNQIVGTVNVGIEIGAGHDNKAYNNRVISSGLLPDGTKIPSQNVGLTIYDNYGNIQRGTMYNNPMNNNVVGWMCWAARCAWDGYRADEYFPDNNSDYYANQTITANPILLSLEEKEYQAWEAKVSANGVTVGPTVSGSTGNQGGGSTPPISTSAWYTIINSNSKLCAEAAAGLPDGVKVRQNTCGTAQSNQEWQFQTTGNGYYRVVNRDALLRTGVDHVWDVTGGPWATAAGTKVQLWTYAGGTNQQWMPISLSNGAWKFVARNSSKCLDVPGASSAVLVTLQQYFCNGTAAQSYALQKEP